MAQFLPIGSVSFFFFFLLLSPSANAQNLLPNPGFELQNSCPITYNQWSLLQDWQAGNSSTPDYYNCGYYGLTVQGSPSDGGGVLGLWGGAQHPACPSSAYVENVQASLTQTMIAGRTYEVSFDVQIDGNGLGSASPNDCIRVGAYFFDSNQAPSLGGLCSPALEPQVFVMGSQVQKGTYTRFTFTITPTESYDQVLWGTFASSLSADAACSSYAGNKMYFNLDQLSVTESQVLSSQIVAFDGERKGLGIELGWELSDPHLVKQMSLEYAMGQDEAFEFLDTIQAFREAAHYQYQIATAPNGLQRYRLKVETLDEGVLYSEVRAFKVVLPPGGSLSPNPASEQICLNLRTQNDEFVTILVRDMQGRVTLQERYHTQAGDTIIKLDLSQWASGMYLVDVCTDSGRLSEKGKFIVR